MKPGVVFALAAVVIVAALFALAPDSLPGGDSDELIPPLYFDALPQSKRSEYLSLIALTESEYRDRVARTVTAALRGRRFVYQNDARTWGVISYKVETTGPAKARCAFRVKWLDAEGYVIDESVAEGSIPGTIADDWTMSPDEYASIDDYEITLLHCAG